MGDRPETMLGIPSNHHGKFKNQKRSTPITAQLYQGVIELLLLLLLLDCIYKDFHTKDIGHCMVAGTMDFYK